MSRIYFHTRSGRRAEVLGSERAYLANLASAIPGSLFYDAAPLWRLTGKGNEYARMPSSWVFGTCGDLIVDFDGVQDEGWLIGLNTLVATKSPALCFAARVHGQCEVHGWVPERHRSWLAGVIADARDDSILRAEVGWESVIALLLDETIPGPVVMSYSVTEGFPDPYLSGASWEEEPWESMSEGERWDVSIAELHPSLEITPETLLGQGFGSGKSAWDVLQSESFAAARKEPARA